jgi:hypothetical protein
MVSIELSCMLGFTERPVETRPNYLSSVQLLDGLNEVIQLKQQISHRGLILVWGLFDWEWIESLKILWSHHL